MELLFVHRCSDSAVLGFEQLPNSDSALWIAWQAIHQVVRKKPEWLAVLLKIRLQVLELEEL